MIDIFNFKSIDDVLGQIMTPTRDYSHQMYQHYRDMKHVHEFKTLPVYGISIFRIH